MAGSPLGGYAAGERIAGYVLFEAGEASGVLFIAMRYVSGGDVGAAAKRAGLLPLEEIAAIGSQVASALDAAHARGLVHRDVKPTNMLLDVRQVHRARAKV